jgi:hypothetical protein
MGVKFGWQEMEVSNIHAPKLLQGSSADKLYA